MYRRNRKWKHTDPMEELNRQYVEQYQTIPVSALLEENLQRVRMLAKDNSDFVIGAFLHAIPNSR
jgi:hypothetical protein